MNSTKKAWFEDRLTEEGIKLTKIITHRPLCHEIKLDDWVKTSLVAKKLDMRFVALWGDEENGRRRTNLFMYVAFDHGEHGIIVLRAGLPPKQPSCPSIANTFIAASRMERIAGDMFGIRMEGAFDTRRWIKHEHWPETVHPLRSDFPADSMMERVDGDYPFLQVEGEGVYEIPVGPIHAGIIEPGHFRFSAVGERILHMEERFGYVHKGIEKRVVGLDPHKATPIISRISGDSAIGFGWAFCRACEESAGVTPPKRALAIRAILSERERIANHIGDIGAICNDVAFAFMHVQLQGLREEMARLHKQIFKHRLLFDSVLPGGVARDIDSQGIHLLAEQTKNLAGKVDELCQIYSEHASIQQRVLGAGVISFENAKSIGLLGYVGRASGYASDQRAMKRYAPYDKLDVIEPIDVCGDVGARIAIRSREITASAKVIITLLSDLPEGDILAPWPIPDTGQTGFALIEGWRGEIACQVRFGAEGKIERCMVRDPSIINWLGLELAVRNVPVPDFPLYNKSFNCSYSGSDL